MTGKLAIFEERFKVQLTLNFEHEPNEARCFKIQEFLYTNLNSKNLFYLLNVSVSPLFKNKLKF